MKLRKKIKFNVVVKESDVSSHGKRDELEQGVSNIKKGKQQKCVSSVETGNGN